MTPAECAAVAAEWRAFAKELRAIRFRGTERYLEELDGLARSIERKADKIVSPCALRSSEPSHFFAGERMVSGRRVQAVVRGRRRAA
jgi:hypothetical protein